MKLLGTTEENLDYEEIELNIVRKVKNYSNIMIKQMKGTYK